MNEGILLNNILQCSSDIIWIKNISLEYTHVSDTFLEAVGRTREDVIGKTRQSQYLFEFEDRIDDKDIINNEMDVEDDELLIYKGTYQMFHVRRYVLKNDNNEVIGLYGMACIDRHAEGAGYAFELVMEDIPYGIIVTNKEGMIIKVNNRISDYLLVDGDILGRNLSEFNLKRDSRKDNDAKISNEQHSFNFFGRDYSFTIQRVPLHNFNGKTEGEVLVLSDLSDEYERVRNQYNEKFSNVLKNAYAEIIELDFHTNSAKFLSDTGHLFDFSNIFKVQDEMELKELRKRMREYVYTDDYDMYDKFFDYDIISAYFADNIMTMMESEIRILNKKNHYSWLRFSISQIKNSNGIITYLCCVKDIDEEKKAEKDSLSTVFNRGAFVKNVKNKLSMRNKAEACAFYMIDIDNFKSINDNYGHNVGDLVIRNIGKIINDIFANKAVPGRMGGDEFAVYQDGIEKTSVVYELADSILEKVHNVAIDMKLHDNVTVSIGAVIVTDGDVSFDKIYQEADKQLYCSKRKLKNCYTVSEVRL